MNEAESVAFGLFADGRNVVRIETAHKEAGAWIHARHIVLHVVQQDVTVDVGYHHIERALVGQDGCVALEYADTINVVQLDVFERIAHTPFVNVDANKLGIASLEKQ